MALFNRGSHVDEYQGVENSAKTLLANIRFMGVDKPIRTLAITSAIPNEGKSFVAMNLANAVATSGRTVLLVECDMRRRSLSGSLDVHPEHGLYSVISGEVPLTAAAVQTHTPRMYFLDAEPHIPNPSDLISSRHFSQLVELARRTFDYVVFDTPPVGTFVDAAVLGAKVDATFLVIRENFTKRDQITRAVDQLQKGGVNLAGVIMNFCERESSEYYYEYYYKEDGHRSERRHHGGRDRDMDDASSDDRSSNEAGQKQPAGVPATPSSWDNAPRFDDGGGVSAAAVPADAAGQSTFRTQGTALTQAVTDLHGQVDRSRQRRLSTEQAQASATDAPQPQAVQAAQAVQAPLSAGTVSSRPNDDMSRYKRRTR